MSQPEGAGTPAEVVENPGQEVTPETPETGSTLSHEEALAELAKVRREAAAKRVKNKELEDAALKWQEYEESQKSELQKLQDAVAEKERQLAQKDLDILRAKIARENNVADEDLDLLVGDEDNMKRLAARLGKAPAAEGRPADLLAGNRGTPLGGSSTTFSMDDFIRGKASTN